MEANPFEIMVKSRIYRRLETSYNADLIEMAANDEVPHNLELVQVCFKASSDLNDWISQCASALGVSKRRFLELSAVNACLHVEHQFEELGGNQESFWTGETLLKTGKGETE